MRQTINGAELRRMIISAAASVEIHKQDLNELNVFPVPDGDTGTNMSMTIHAAAADLRAAEDPGLNAASKVAASAMLRGARGNSGVILSLLFRGLSKKLKGNEECDGVLWAQALQAGVDAAYKAVMKPAEGTILTVSRLAAAKALEAAEENNYIEFVQEAAITEAKEALANTVNQNPVLKRPVWWMPAARAGSTCWRPCSAPCGGRMWWPLRREKRPPPRNRQTSPTSTPRTSSSPTARSLLSPGRIRRTLRPCGPS